MTFVGIDLAADPARTGLAVLDSDRLEHVEVGVGDDGIVERVHTATRSGVDVPFGWPADFAAFLSAHARGALAAPEDTGKAWRRPMALRATDRAVHRRTGLTPLSVSTDRIAYPALRWAGIEARLRDRGVDASRDGTGAICEVYPAAALRLWSLPHRGYKGSANAQVRVPLVAALANAFPALDWNGFHSICESDDNALDAVIAALVAREVERGACEPPPDALTDLAAQEGWIWLPR